MQSRVEASRPAKGDIRFNKPVAIRWVWIVGNLGWNRKAPDVTLPGAIRICIIDLINSPVVSSARNKALGGRKAGKSNYLGGRGQIADKGPFGAVVDIIEADSEVQIMRDRETSRHPRETGPCSSKHSPVLRDRTPRKRKSFAAFHDNHDLIRRQWPVVEAHIVDPPMEPVIVYPDIPSDPQIHVRCNRAGRRGGGGPTLACVNGDLLFILVSIHNGRHKDPFSQRHRQIGSVFPVRAGVSKHKSVSGLVGTSLISVRSDVIPYTA